jgi:hypothetical protein
MTAIFNDTALAVHKRKDSGSPRNADPILIQGSLPTPDAVFARLDLPGAR